MNDETKADGLDIELAALLDDAGGWGTVGDSGQHRRYMIPARNRRKRCRCGCKSAMTHYGMCNGVSLMSGCEATVVAWTERSVVR